MIALDTPPLDSLTGELVKLQDQLVAVQDLTRRLHPHLEPQDALAHLVDGIKQALPGRDVLARLQLPHLPPLLFTSGAGGDGERLLEEALQMVEGQENYLLQNSQTPAVLLPPGLTGWLLLPLVVRERVCGVVALVDRHGVSFSIPDLQVSQTLISQYLTYCENLLWHEDSLAQAQLQAQLAIAQEVQRCLLPHRPPAVPSIDIWASSIALHSVGGDFYDFFAAGGDSTYVAIGDVCGKGVSAAMMMTMTRTALREAAAFLPAGACGPAALLTHLNAALYEDYSKVGLFASTFLGELVPGDPTIFRYANAGQAPIIYAPLGGEATILPAMTPSVGLLPQIQPHEPAIPLRDGDLLVLATDGLFEAINGDDELFGLERLLETVSRAANQSAADIGAILSAVVEAFRGNAPPTDDQTLVVIKKVPADV